MKRLYLNIMKKCKYIYHKKKFCYLNVILKNIEQIESVII